MSVKRVRCRTRAQVTPANSGRTWWLVSNALLPAVSAFAKEQPHWSDFVFPPTLPAAEDLHDGVPQQEFRAGFGVDNRVGEDPSGESLTERLAVDYLAAVKTAPPEASEELVLNAAKAGDVLLRAAGSVERAAAALWKVQEAGGSRSQLRSIPTTPPTCRR